MKYNMNIKSLRLAQVLGPGELNGFMLMDFVSRAWMVSQVDIKKGFNRYEKPLQRPRGLKVQIQKKRVLVIETNIYISVVIPVYNSQDSLDVLYTRIAEVFDKEKFNWEIIFVNDCSKDNSYKILEGIRQKDKRAKIINLSRNFGQHNATMCGFKHSRGEYVVTIDDDLQYPPEEIINLLKEIKKGYEVVMGIPKDKKHEIYRNLGSKTINLLNSIIFKKPIDLKLSSFRIIRKETIKKIISVNSPYCYIPSNIFRYVSFDRISNIDVNHEKRKYGHSTYTLGRLIKLSSNLLINHSSILLRLGIRFGFLISFLCIAYSLYILFRQLFGQPVLIQGWASLAVLITFLFGILFIYLGIISEYIYRILVELYSKEQYIIKDMYLED